MFYLLHSIMYLLILNLAIWVITYALFTFHNVSINSAYFCPSFRDFVHLHSIMYLLIPEGNPVETCKMVDLHSIMYLLILICSSVSSSKHTVFTFHNVSINSGLHVNIKCNVILFTFHNVSINSESVALKNAPFL